MYTINIPESHLFAGSVFILLLTDTKAIFQEDKKHFGESFICLLWHSYAISLDYNCITL